MYVLNYDISLVWVLILLNLGVILALILVLLELREMRRFKKSLDQLFGTHERILERDENVFGREIEELKNVIMVKDSKIETGL